MVSHFPQYRTKSDAQRAPLPSCHIRVVIPHSPPPSLPLTHPLSAPPKVASTPHGIMAAPRTLLIVGAAAMVWMLPGHSAATQLFFRGANTDFHDHRNWKGNTPFEGTPSSIVWGAPPNTVSNGEANTTPNPTALSVPHLIIHRRAFHATPLRLPRHTATPSTSHRHAFHVTSPCLSSHIATPSTPQFAPSAGGATFSANSTLTPACSRCRQL